MQLPNVVVAEWLRRLTRNQMGFTRTGSNPVHDGLLNFFLKLQIGHVHK